MRASIARARSVAAGLREHAPVAAPMPSAELVHAVRRGVGREPIEWRTPHAGLSAAKRFVVTLAGGEAVFVKAATDDRTEAWLRTDHVAMRAAGELAPSVVAWTEADGRPVLITESLHDAYWPAGVFAPPGSGGAPVVWKAGQVDQLASALESLASLPAPVDLAPLSDVFEPQWPRIAAEPSRVLALGLVDAAWLEVSLEQLIAAEASLDLTGTRLVHNDVRSDNVCFLHGRVVLVDWSDARRGPRGFDLANLLQTLPLEGGPEPHDVLPSAAPFAAWRAGEMLNRASGLDGPAPAWLVKVMKRLALIDLRWAAVALDLPTGLLPHWRDI